MYVHTYSITASSTYIQTGKITVLYFLIFKIFDMRWEDNFELNSSKNSYMKDLLPILLCFLYCILVTIQEHLLDFLLVHSLLDQPP
jgi:hypothetical protein